MRREEIEAIFEKEEVMELFFHNSGLNGAVNKNGHFVYLSDTWSQVLGWSEKELLETPFMQFIHQDDYKKTLEAYNTNDHYQEKHEKGFINRYKCKDGSYIHIYWKTWAGKIRQLNLFSAEPIHDQDIAKLMIKKLQ